MFLRLSFTLTFSKLKTAVLPPLLILDSYNLTVQDLRLSECIPLCLDRGHPPLCTFLLLQNSVIENTTREDPEMFRLMEAGNVTDRVFLWTLKLL